MMALALLAGCAKNEQDGVSGRSGSHNFSLTLTVDDAATRAVYDGAHHIVWESGDNLYLALGGQGMPTPVYIAAREGAAASQYFYSFRIVDATAETPSFSGAFYSIVDDEWEENYTLYGLKGDLYDGAKYADDLTKITVNLPADQKATQTSWDGRYDYMLIAPTPISLSEYTYNSQYGEYSSTQSVSVELAHLFGFGCLSFADIPAEFENQVVKQVIITATGANKDLAGRYTVDLTKKVSDSEFAVSAKSTLASIYLAGDGATTLKNYKAWFVANPGTFDVTVTVKTNAADFTFEREGLLIERASIASPVVHFKSADTLDDKTVDLTGDIRWQHDAAAGGYTAGLSSSAPEKEWGTLANTPKMVFSCAYPGSNNNNYPSYSSPLQYVAYNNILGGTVELASAAPFKGVKNIKVNTGINSNNVEADFSVYFVSLTGEATLAAGPVRISGTTANTDGQNLCFRLDETMEGCLKLVWNQFSETNCRPYIREIALNDVPNIQLGETKVKVAAAGAEGSIDCEVALADGEVEVSVSEEAASWLSASYADGAIRYTVAENTGAGRTAIITVRAAGIGENTAEIEVKQVSATQVEYKLSFDATDIEEALEAAAEAYEETNGNPASTSTVLSFTVPLTAQATDNSGKTTEVTISFENVFYDYVGEEIYVRYNYSSQGIIRCQKALGMITRVEAVANQMMSTSMYSGYNAYLSKDGSSWPGASTFGPVNEGSSPYTSHIENEDEDYQWFKLQTNVNTRFTSVAVTFVVD